jgi:hypothetical protein
MNDRRILSNAELEVTLAALVSRKNAFLLIAIIIAVAILIIFLSVFGISMHLFTMVYILAMPFLVYGAVAASINKKIKAAVSGNMVSGIFSNAFELSHFDPFGKIHPHLVISSGLIDPVWHLYNGNDLIKGRYKGVNFTFSDLHLISGSGKSAKTIFMGQWLICELNHSFPDKLRLRKRSFFSVGQKSDVETENTAFNDKYQILTSNPHAASTLLTPHFMEYILNMDARAGAQTSLSLTGNQLHIAVHSKRDLFKPNVSSITKPHGISCLRGQIREDVNRITGLIDELLLNQYLLGGD